MDYFSSASIPEHTYKLISTTIIDHSVTLLRIEYDPPGVDNPSQVGSGTFITNGKDYGILTAHHVITEFNSESCLGLTLSSDEDDYKIPWKELDLLSIGVPKTDENGPDLVFIRLSSYQINEIERYKSFYPLLDHREELLTNPPDLDIGLWVVCGGLQEKTRTEDSQGRFSACITFEQFCGFGKVEREYTLDGFDYLEFDLEHCLSTEKPTTFKGMSGGGLWQIPINRGVTDEFIPSRYLLSGLIYWRSPVVDNWRYLKCHGRKSINEIVWNRILETK
jgi:hypothetical protein